MAANERQDETDRPRLTRAAVAKRLGRDISWVRRREGKELHPVLADGAYRFDVAEVDALRQQVVARQLSDQEAEQATERAHRMFDLHLGSPRRFSVEGIAQAVGFEPRAVRTMHAKWADEFLTDVPRLLTRRELLEIEEREEREAEREHRQRMAQWEREAEEHRKQMALEAKRRQDESKVEEVEFARRRARRKAEAEASVAALRNGGSAPELAVRLAKVVEAKTFGDLLSALLD